MSLDRFSQGKNTLVSSAFELSGHHFLTLSMTVNDQENCSSPPDWMLVSGMWTLIVSSGFFFFWQFTGALLYLFVQRGTPSQPLICKNLYYYFFASTDILAHHFAVVKINYKLPCITWFISELVLRLLSICLGASHGMRNRMRIEGKIRCLQAYKVFQDLNDVPFRLGPEIHQKPFLIFLALLILLSFHDKYL